VTAKIVPRSVEGPAVKAAIIAAGAVGTPVPVPLAVVGVRAAITIRQTVIAVIMPVVTIMVITATTAIIPVAAVAIPVAMAVLVVAAMSPVAVVAVIPVAVAPVAIVRVSPAAVAAVGIIARVVRAAKIGGPMQKRVRMFYMERNGVFMNDGVLQCGRSRLRLRSPGACHETC
jgi:hypothetical protein